MGPLGENLLKLLCLFPSQELVSRVNQAYTYSIITVPPHLADHTSRLLSLLIRARRLSLMAHPQYLYRIVHMTGSRRADVDLLCIHGRRREAPRSLVDLRLQQMSNSSLQTSMVAQGLERLH